MKRTLLIIGVVACAGLAGLAVYANSRRQKADNDWVPAVSRPAFTTDHPRVILDEAHYNSHTAQGKYQPFARLLEADGYQVSRAGKSSRLKVSPTPESSSSSTRRELRNRRS